MVGRWDEEYAPAPRRNTAFKSASVILVLEGCFFLNSANLFFREVITDSDSFMLLADVSDAALPFGFFLEP
jgi:hypothetical protein